MVAALVLSSPLPLVSSLSPMLSVDITLNPLISLERDYTLMSTQD